MQTTTGRTLAAIEPTRGIRRAAVLACAALLLIGVLGSYHRYRQNLDTETRQLVQETGEVAAALDHQLDLYRFSIDALALDAADMLGGLYTLNIDITDQLLQEHARGGYYLGDLPGAWNRGIGELTGLGPLPEPGSQAAREMDMALGLTPLFQAIRNRDPSLPWIYYVSAQQFVYIYPPPREQGRDFFFSDQVKQLAGPALNPERRTRWTAAYRDLVTQAPMVTLSRPVYEGDSYRGTLGLDIQLQSLIQRLRARPVPHASLQLLTRDGRDLLGDRASTVPKAVVSARPGQVLSHDGDSYAAFPLRAADWVLVARAPRGALAWEALKATSLMAGAVLAVLCCLLLMVLLGRSMQQVQRMAIKDALTGLYNRRHFDEVARLEFAHRRRDGGWLGLAIVDIDYFKKYNDHYGHQEGDRVLARVAQALRSTLQRETDGVFRVGGEEFAVLVKLGDPADMALLLERLCQAIRDLATPHVQSDWQRVTLSLGATVIGGDDTTDVDTAYRQADAALYRAKQGGRNRYALEAYAER